MTMRCHFPQLSQWIWMLRKTQQCHNQAVSFTPLSHGSAVSLTPGRVTVATTESSSTLKGSHFICNQITKSSPTMGEQYCQRFLRPSRTIFGCFRKIFNSAVPLTPPIRFQIRISRRLRSLMKHFSVWKSGPRENAWWKTRGQKSREAILFSTRRSSKPSTQNEIAGTFTGAEFRSQTNIWHEQCELAPTYMLKYIGFLYILFTPAAPQRPAHSSVPIPGCNQLGDERVCCGLDWPGINHQELGKEQEGTWGYYDDVFTPYYVHWMFRPTLFIQCMLRPKYILSTISLWPTHI